MSRSLTLLLLLLPISLYSNDQGAQGLLQIDVAVKVVSADSVELWSVDFKKYTISGRSISINLHGFDGELKATLLPIINENGSMVLETSSVVKSLDSEKIIQESFMRLQAEFGEKLLLYPIGNLENVPNVIMELSITKHNGEDD
jgi:hypothetical protein